MRTCAHCRCWRRVGHSPVPRRLTYDTGVRVVPMGDEGECRAGPPREDFRWALTSAGDWCGQWAAPQADFATGAAGTGQPAHAEGGGEPAGAVAPDASRSTAPQTGAATPARPARASRVGGRPGDVGRPALLHAAPGAADQETKGPKDQGT
jgi:hypothetical protein